MSEAVTLIGDGIENPANAVVMQHAAAMFGAGCRFRDTKGLGETQQEGIPPSHEPFARIDVDQIRGLHPRIIAFDNLPRAAEVYGYRAGGDFAVMVGNERRGLSYDCAKLATDKVQVPMHSRRIDCLNVAAASAVALYYLCAPKAGTMAVRKDPRSRRPELLLLGPGDHFELGSTIRSAAGFGWERAFVEDRQQAWFGCDRATRSEGRAAARRGKNEILLVPCPTGTPFSNPRVTVITCRESGTPLHRANFTGGPGQLVVIPDEGGVDVAAENWSRFGGEVEFAQLRLPRTEFTYHYRLMATIALAEIARQVGRRPAGKAPAGPRPPFYDRSMGRLAEVAGESVSFEELVRY